MASNLILPFGQAAVSPNTLSDAAYATDPQRTIGHQIGVARNELENKALVQATSVAAGLAQFIADNQANNVTDALTPAQIESYLIAALSSLYALKGGSTTQRFSVANGEANTDAVAMGQFSQIIGLSGYQKFPSGLIMQWGQQSTYAPNTNYTFVYPIPFPTQAVSASIQVNDSGGPSSTSITSALGNSSYTWQTSDARNPVLHMHLVLGY